MRWIETVEKMAQQGVTHIIECGPGKVLAGMVMPHRARREMPAARGQGEGFLMPRWRNCAAESNSLIWAAFCYGLGRRQQAEQQGIDVQC